LAGEKNFSVFAGERLRMHLVFEHGKYVGWAQNSIEPLSDLPERLRVLPDRLGQVIRAVSNPDSPIAVVGKNLVGCRSPLR
jgi:hypothetical protein